MNHYRRKTRRFAYKSRRMHSLWRMFFALGVILSMLLIIMAVFDSARYVPDPASLHSLPIGVSVFS